MNTKSVIKNYLSNNLSSILSLAFIAFLTIAFKIFSPICMNIIVDLSINDFSNNMDKIVLFTSLMGVSTVCSFIFDSIRQAKTIKLGNEITSTLRTNCFQAVMKSELYEINKFEKEDISDILVDSTHLVGDIYIASRICKLIYLGLFVVAILITMFAFEPLFGFVTLVTLPIIYFIAKYLNKISAKRTSIYISKKENHEYIIKDHFDQLKTIKTRNGISKETNDYKKVLNDNKKAYSKDIYLKEINQNVTTIIFIGLTWLSFLIMGCVFLYENPSINNVGKVIGSIVGCIALSPKIFSIYKQLLDVYFVNLNIDAHFQKIDSVLNIKAESRSENIPSLEEVHSLKLNNVSFDYTGYGITNKVSLDKIDFEIKKGEKLGIIGLPGSGKTTIADLITKVVRPRQGNVLINNCDINKLNTYYLRDIVTYVPQNFELLDASIEENIIYPLSLDEYKYNDSLNKCHLKDKIFSLSNRDETNARKAEFTNADIQKIALANAFYKDSPIMILDDATSKLDAATEHDIMSEIYKLKNKITIIISNRITNLTKCDKILIINNGKAAEYGKTEELLEDKHSSFARMIQETQNRRVV